MKSEIQKIHFIGICGVAMSALAIALHKKEFKITGSDKGFFPPVSDYLKNAGIEYYPGWHPERMGAPDLVVVGNVAGSENPEWVYVQENKIPYVSYPELIAKYFVKKNSIVCAGTYGKTTSTCLLTWILKKNGFDPSYMFGGLSLNDMDSAHLSDTFPGRVAKKEYSVLEGDEYKTARWDNGPKFSHYSPTHLLLTSVNWDHADVYPTERSYIEAFEKLLSGLPKNATIVVSEKVKKIERLSAYGGGSASGGKDCEIVKYGKNNNNDYQYTDVRSNKNALTFNINHNGTCYVLRATCYGDYMADNITGCFAMAHQIGIEPEGIIKAVASWRGLKRRLEKRLDGKITIFDDIAHSPAKAQAVLSSLSNIYKTPPPFFKGRAGVGLRSRALKIIAIFEPNTGNRKEESVPGYANAFENADEVIIPRLTQIKISKDDPAPPFDGQKLAEIISQTHNNVKYIDDDEKLVQYIVDNANEGDVVIFLGSHGFRGMIDEVVRACGSVSL